MLAHNARPTVRLYIVFSFTMFLQVYIYCGHIPTPVIQTPHIRMRGNVGIILAFIIVFFLFMIFILCRGLVHAAFEHREVDLEAGGARVVIIPGIELTVREDDGSDPPPLYEATDSEAPPPTYDEASQAALDDMFVEEDGDILEPERSQ
jgi:hypothetical protein